ncbi:MAG: hypothetical protein ABI680_04845 [Chthoniobacteraceae bacterium]
MGKPAGEEIDAPVEALDEVVDASLVVTDAVQFKLVGGVHTGMLAEMAPER